MLHSTSFSPFFWKSVFALWPPWWRPGSTFRSVRLPACCRLWSTPKHLVLPFAGREERVVFDFEPNADASREVDDFVLNPHLYITNIYYIFANQDQIFPVLTDVVVVVFQMEFDFLIRIVFVPEVEDCHLRGPPAILVTRITNSRNSTVDRSCHSYITQPTHNHSPVVLHDWCVG